MADDYSNSDSSDDILTSQLRTQEPDEKTPEEKRKALLRRKAEKHGHLAPTVNPGMSNRTLCLVVCGLLAFLAFVVWLKLNEEDWHPEVRALLLLKQLILRSVS